MHQDQRIGLALGVLLVGACAAFFFRNETRTASNTPRLQRAQELDDRIAERTTRPYLKGIEAVETADRRRSTTRTDNAHSDDDDGAITGNNPESLDDKLTKSPVPRFHRPGTRLSDSCNEIQELAPIAIPSDERSPGESVSEGSPSDKTSESIAGRGLAKSSRSATGNRTHVVQKGETLSSIAAKTLGNSSRFHELFEANHDQLDNPNDVKLGMILQIPDHKNEGSSKPLAHGATTAVEKVAPNVESFAPPVERINVAPTTPLESNSQLPSHNAQDSILLPPALPNENPSESPVDLGPPDESSPLRKFVPAPRSPVHGRPIGPQSSHIRQREVSGRKLSQAALESTSGKVAR